VGSGNEVAAFPHGKIHYIMAADSGNGGVSANQDGRYMKMCRDHGHVTTADEVQGCERFKIEKSGSFYTIRAADNGGGGWSWSPNGKYMKMCKNDGHVTSSWSINSCTKFIIGNAGGGFYYIRAADNGNGGNSMNSGGKYMKMCRNDGHVTTQTSVSNCEKFVIPDLDSQPPCPAGTVYTTGQNNKVYKRDHCTMMKESDFSRTSKGNVKNIAIGGNMIYGVGTNNNIYWQTLSLMTTSTNWHHKGKGDIRSIAIDGNTIYGVGGGSNTEGDFCVYKQELSKMTPTSEWVKTSRGYVESIAIKGDIIYGVGKDHCVYQQDLSKMTTTSHGWVKTSQGDVTSCAVGCLLVVA